MWGCKIVGTLQDAWHIARFLKRFATLSTNDRVIIFGWGGRGEGGGEGVGGGGAGNFCPTQAHAACDMLLMLCSELFPVTFWARLDAMLRIFSCNSSHVAHLEDVVTLKDSWHVARCLASCRMLETFRNIVDEWPCDYFWGGGEVGGKLLSDTRRHMQLVTRSWCSALNFFQSLFEPVLTLCSEFSLVTCQRSHI